MANILLIVYDNGSHIPFFPQGIFALYCALKAEGTHNVGVYHQDLHHGRAKAITKILDENSFDIVGLGFVAGYWQYRKAKEISEAVNASKRRNQINYVLGGHGPAAEPQYFMDRMGADTVVIGDAEKTITEIANGNHTGILHGDPCTRDSFDLDCYNDFPMGIYKLIRWPTSKPTDFCFPILSSRGCKWSCSFCYRMRKGFHQRAVGAIIDEIKFLHKNAQINHFQFSDELLMASRARTEEICHALSSLNFRIKWDCNGRLNFAKPKILQLMRKSGCEYINYGIESLNQEMLNQMGKGLTLEQIHQGVEATIKTGIAPGLNLIWGFPGDTVDNLEAAVKFLIKYDPCHELRTIRPVTPYPGTNLYAKAVTDSLLTGPEDFYENKHVNSDLFSVNFMDISTEEAHYQLHVENRKLIENYYNKVEFQTKRNAEKLYNGDTSFRGFRDV